MEEVDADAVDLGRELWMRVQAVGDTPHLVAVAPVVAQALDVIERDPLRPVVDVLRLRPARALEPRAEIIDLRVGDRDLKGDDCLAHRSRSLACTGGAGTVTDGDSRDWGGWT